ERLGKIALHNLDAAADDFLEHCSKIDIQSYIFFLSLRINPAMKNFLFSNGYSSAFDPLAQVTGRGLVPLGTGIVSLK
ncbi:MAG: hypothetical protein II435_04315, partial [Bacteroidales bacterium]|nr:hypothetical protein [Bacteroidales bacterium]